MSRKQRLFPRVVMLLFFIYLLLPLLATLLYAFAEEWQDTLLPKSWTLQWFAQLFHDERFITALQHTFVVTFASVILSLVVMLPTIFIIVVYFPRLEKIMNALVVLPFAVPAIVAAVGLIKLYSKGPFPIAGTVWILIGAYFIVLLPFMYQGIRNSLRTVHAVRLVEAASLLGASKLTAFLLVVLPNILPGVTVSVLLSFAMLFGEFALANLLVGGQFETVQIYLFQRQHESGHLSSAVAISYFVVVMLLSGLMLRISKWAFHSSRTVHKAGRRRRIRELHSNQSCS